MLRKISRLFQKADSNSEALRVYLDWRNVIFSVTGPQGGVVTDSPDQVYGVVLDVSLSEEFIISITAFATGESSLRTTIGGGVTGLGGMIEIAEQAKQIVALAQSLVGSLSPIDNHNLPTSKKVFFYFLTTSGIRRREFNSMKDMDTAGHPFQEMLQRFNVIKAKSDQLMQGSR